MRRSEHDWAIRCLAGAALALSACSGNGETTALAEPPGEPAATVAQDDYGPAPAWELPDLEGNQVRSDSLAGKIVVMDFWATWCPPCLLQIPILNSVQAKHQGDDVVVIGVAVDAEGAEVVKPFAKKNGIQYRILIGDEALARKFGAPGFPAMAIVGREGRIDSTHVGLIEEDDLDAAIAKVQGS